MIFQIFAVFVLTIVNFFSVSNIGAEFIDLSFTFNNQTPMYPGRVISIHVETEGETPSGFWASTRRMCLSEHTSTHIDANYHFDRTGWTLDQIPLSTLLEIPGVVIDISKKVFTFDDNGKPIVIENYACSRDDIIEWEQENGQIPPHSVVFLRTGWASKWRDPNEYLGIPEADRPKPSLDGKPSIVWNVNTNFPGFSEDAAIYLSYEKQLYGAGIDTVSLDPGDNKFQAAHLVFMKRMWLIENVANLHLLPPRNFTVWIAPFKVDKGTGAPARIVAKINEKEF